MTKAFTVVQINRIKAKVEAVNKANAEANRLYPILLEICKRYQYHSDYSVAFCVKTSVNIPDDHGCLYHETMVYVAELDANTNTIKGLSLNFVPYRTDYTVEEVKRLTEEKEQAEKAFDNAKSALRPFDTF